MSEMNLHRCRFVDYTPHTITAMAFSHNSSTQIASNDLRLAVGRGNGDIEIWNPKFNWTHELTLFGSRGRSIEGLCWAINEGDSQPRLFSIGGSTYVTEWDLKTGLPKINYDCNVGVIWSISVNNNGNKLAVGCDDGSVAIIDISGGFGSMEHEMICQRQELRVLSIKWFENSVIGGCADGRIRCWSLNKDDRGRIVGTMRVDKSKTESTLVWSINILSKRKQIISGDSTGCIKIWDLETFTLLQNFTTHEADVLCIVNDFNEEKIFTAGVDRKIHQFNLINLNQKNKNSKWSHTYNRLLHSNDVRTMVSFESKGYNLLVSGGVEKSIVIQSVNQFNDGHYRKLSLNQQISNILINQLNNLIIMWQDQTVKIWKIQSNTKYKLVAKLSLNDDENISHVTINDEGTLLSVSTMSSVKVFELIHNSKKILVQKFKDEQFNSIISSCKQSIIYNTNKFLILTNNDELYQFQIDISNKTIELINEVEFEESSDQSLTYLNNIKNMKLNHQQDKLAISRFNGIIEIVDLNDLSSIKLTTLENIPHLIEFSNNDTLIVLSEDNKIFEFNIEKSKDLLTSWSKRNSDFLPKQFLSLKDKPEGMFVDNNKIWIYGKEFLCYFDLNLNIPISKMYKNTGISKKRNRDGLTIEDDEDDEEIDDDSIESSLKQNQINRLRQQFQNEPIQDDEKPFWINLNYRSILFVNKLSSDLIIIERPISNNTPAFNLPKIKV